MQRRVLVLRRVIADSDKGWENVCVGVPDPVQHIKTLVLHVVAQLVVRAAVIVLFVVLHRADIAAMHRHTLELLGLVSTARLLSHKQLLLLLRSDLLLQ